MRVADDSPELGSPRHTLPVAPGFPVRERLLRELDSLPAGGWLIGSGPGYGKTSLVNTWCRRQKEKVAWFSLSTGDREVSCFLDGLTSSVRVAHPEFDLRLQGHENLQQISDALATALRAVGKIILVLDNLQTLRGGASLELVAKTLEFRPPDLHMILISTGRLGEQDWLRAELHGNLHYLGVETLSFRPAEVSLLMGNPGRVERRKRSKNWSEDESFELLSQTGGWPLAVDNLTRTLQSSESTEDVLDDYLESIWADMSALDKELLKRFAPFETVGEELASLLVTDSEPVTSRFKDLVQFGIFLTPLKAKRWRIASRVREFLLGKLRLSHKQFVDSHARAAEVMVRLGNSMAAAKNLLEIEEKALAKKLLAESPVPVSEQKFPRLQAELLARLDDESDQSNSQSIALARATALGRAGDIKGSLALLEELAAAGEESGEVELQVAALTERAQLLIDTSQPLPAIEAVEQAMSLVREDGQKTRLLAMLTANSVLRGKIRGLKEKASTSGELSTDARYLVRTGQLQSLQLRVESLTSGCDMWEVKPRRSFLDPDLAGSFVAACQGDFDTAEFYANRSVERGRRFQCMVTEAIGLARLGHAYALSERPKEARRAYQESADLCDQMGVARVKAEPLMGLTFLAAAEGENEAGIRHAEASAGCLEDTGDLWAQGQIHLAHGAALLPLDQHGGRAKIQRAIDLFQECEDPHLECAATLWLARDGGFNLKEAEQSARHRGFGFLLERPTLYGPRKLSAPSRQPALRVSTFGRIRVWRDGEEIQKPFSRKKARELFALFLQKRDQLLRKDFLIDLLWPEKFGKNADGDFRVALHGVAAVLDPNRPKKSGVRWMERTAEGYSLKPDEHFVVDCVRFEEALTAAQESSDDAQRAVHLREAVDLYSGEYLQEFPYEEWCMGERVRYQELFLEAAEELALHSLQCGEHQNALQLANSILSVDPAWEEAYRIGIRVHLEKGRTGQALRAYEECVRTLEKEIGLGPSEETTTLIQGALDSN